MSRYTPMDWFVGIVISWHAPSFLSEPAKCLGYLALMTILWGIADAWTDRIIERRAE